MRVVDREHEAGDKARPEVVSGALARVDREERGMTTIRRRVTRGTTEDLGPVARESLEMLVLPT